SRSVFSLSRRNRCIAVNAAQPSSLTFFNATHRLQSLSISLKSDLSGSTHARDIPKRIVLHSKKLSMPLNMRRHFLENSYYRISKLRIVEPKDWAAITDWGGAQCHPRIRANRR